MISDIFRDYIGRVVIVETDQQSHKGLSYMGKIVDYDEHFIRLGPVTRIGQTTGGKKLAYDEVCGKYYPEVKKRVIDLNKRIIATLEEVLEDPEQ